MNVVTKWSTVHAVWGVVKGGKEPRYPSEMVQNDVQVAVPAIMADRDGTHCGDSVYLPNANRRWGVECGG